VRRAILQSGILAVGFEEEERLLFVNKKKQKNFDLLGAVAAASPKPAIPKSFLLLFFKKEVLACLPSW
jgi:hypothetical protein